MPRATDRTALRVFLTLRRQRAGPSALVTVALTLFALVPAPAVAGRKDAPPVDRTPEPGELAAIEPLPTVEEGVSLYERGELDAAVEIYRRILAADPEDQLARYELAMTEMARGNYGVCIELAEQVLASGTDPDPARSMSLVAICLDESGKHRKAARAFRRAIEQHPDDANLHYGLAVTELRRERFAEAIEAAKRAVELAPAHASNHLLLANAFALEGHRVPALLAGLRFLGLEPDGPRAQQALALLDAQLGLGVEQTAEGEYQISMPAESATGEGDFQAMELVMSIAAVNPDLGDQTPTPFRKTLAALATVLDLYAGSPPGAPATFSARLYYPYYRALHEAGLAEPYLALALSAADLDGADAWQAEHAGELARAEAWMAAHAGMGGRR